MNLHSRAVLAKSRQTGDPDRRRVLRRCDAGTSAGDESYRPKRVAFFASAFHPSLGGVEELVRQLGHQSLEQGAPALILTNRWPRDLPARETFEGLALRRHRFRLSFNQRLREIVAARLTQPVTVRSLCSELREHRTEIVHVQCVSSNAHYAMLAAQRLGLPFVVSLQGELTMDATGLFQRSAVAQAMLRKVLDAADAITACSRQTLKEAEEFYGHSFRNRGSVVYNGIRFADFQEVRPFQHPRPYFLAIGRHVPQKGFDVLIRAYAALVREMPSVPDLILAGDGPSRPALEILAKEIAPPDRVHFAGRSEREMTSRLFAGCETFILPSRHEPMGIVNLEAMAAGKAVIATRVGGVPEIVPEGECGLLVPADDPGALAEAMSRLVTSPELRARLGAASRKHARSFDWANIWLEYQAIYDLAISSSGRRQGQPE